MKKLTSKQFHKVKALNKDIEMDKFESRVSNKAKAIFKRPPYGGKQKEESVV